MNIKKIVVLILFAVAIIGIIAPANAALNGYVSKYSSYGYKPEKLYVCIQSNIELDKSNWKSSNSVTKRKNELNKVNKISIKVQGYNSTVIKRPSSGWSTYQYADAFEKNFVVKKAYKSLKGQTYTISLYDKNNKLLRDPIRKTLGSG